MPFGDRIRVKNDEGLEELTSNTKKKINILLKQPTPKFSEIDPLQKDSKDKQLKERFRPQLKSISNQSQQRESLMGGSVLKTLGTDIQDMFQEKTRKTPKTERRMSTRTRSNPNITIDKTTAGKSI